MDLTRRNFVAAAAASPFILSATGALANMANGPVLKVAVIGCGGRGTGAMFNAISAGKTSGCTIEVIALADLFPDRANNANQALAENGMKAVPADRVFTGFDAYKKACATDCDFVILATPPGFRSIHFKEATAKGKHVFCEKPVAVDGPGVRRFLEAAAVSRSKKLKVVAGTQRRHETCYIDSVGRIAKGDIGRVASPSCLGNAGLAPYTLLLLATIVCRFPCRLAASKVSESGGCAAQPCRPAGIAELATSRSLFPLGKPSLPTKLHLRNNSSSLC